MPLAVCATPIGNLDDVTLRVIRELREADLVLCEDTRRTRTLLRRHGVHARLASYHAHNEAARTAEVVPRLMAGERIALVSDAGLPGVNDPGMRLFAAALEAGVEATVLPGPSAVETALVASGLAAEGYVFVGFVPRAERGRHDLWEHIRDTALTLVAFESPRRLPAALASLAAVLPERRAAVCRELTKQFEDVVRGTAAELAARFAEPPRGEITLVVAGEPRVAGARAAREVDAAAAAVRDMVAGGLPRRQAVELAARLTGLKRNVLYEASL